MSKITVVAKVVAKSNTIEQVRDELIKMIAPTRYEPGCLEYRLHQDKQDPTVFIFYENWDSEACLAGHMDSDHFKDYVCAVDGLLGEKVVHKMTRIEPGGEE